jgi:type IV pilus assembly protein PilQ
MMRALVVATITTVGLTPAVVHADRDLCAKTAKHHGATIDLDLQGADLQDTLRLLTDVGRTNLVIGDNVEGKVTLRLKRIPWDAAVCTIAAVHHLTVIVQDNILLVRKAG